MKKIITCILIMILSLHILPARASSAPIIKSIDTIPSNLEMRVDNKKISHKQIFSWDKQIYIPISDLANGLELGTKISTDNTKMYLNSNGRLNLKDTSPAYIAYQRGYEIHTKNRLIKDIEKLINGDSNTITKQEKHSLRVGFGDISIYLDSQAINLYPQPLIYNGDIYVEISSISRHFLLTPSIENGAINFDTNAVLINQPTKLQQEILAIERNTENTRLSRRLAEMNKKKKIMLDLKLPYMEVNNTYDMERYLNKYFSKIDIDEDDYVEFDIDLSKNTDSSYYIEITIQNRYRSDWYRLEKSQVQAYIWDLYTAITNLLDEEAKVQGAIRNPNYSRKNYVTFDTRYKDLNFNFTDSGLDLKKKVDINFIKDLLHEYRSSIYRYERFNFEARMSGYDLQLSIEDLYGTYLEDWNIYDKTDFLDSIGRIIHRQYPNLKIVGRISYKDKFVDFTIDQDTHSSDLIAQLNKILNERYSSLTKNGVRVNINYTLTEENNQINLMAYTDISRSGKEWSEQIEAEINNTVHKALEEILSLFDKDVVVKIFDKDGNRINDYGVFKNTVASVRATPSGGEVLSSQAIELFTDTSGATIYYTTDNTNPTVNSTKYTGEFTIAEDTIIKAFATKADMKDSSVSTFIFKVVSAEDMSKGLDELKIIPENLNLNFKRTTKTYTLTAGSDVNSIILTPIASTGKIKINGVEIESGASKTIDINQSKTLIEISHKEDDKKEFVYTITINKSITPVDIELRKEVFNTSIVGSFKGYLTSNSIEDFSAYTVVLMTKSDKEIKRTRASSSGEFTMKFDINIINNIIGYKYEVLAPNGSKVTDGEL